MMRSTVAAPTVPIGQHSERGNGRAGDGLARRTVVVVGNGMVSHRFCERLVGNAGERYRLVVLGEEPHSAYDRVHLTQYFTDRSADRLRLGAPGWYAAQGIDLHLATRVIRIDRARREVVTADGLHVGLHVPYDVLVLATGSAPFVPKVPGVDKRGVFVYRTIEDLEGILACTANARRAAVIGGGLLGLEAARAVHDAGIETHVVEVAPRLMPRQLDPPASALLEATIRALGVHVRLDQKLLRITGDDVATGLEFAGGETLDVDLVIFSAGIRPRDELAKDAGIVVGERGGVVVDDQLCTSDPSIFAVGEVALHRGMIYGLVAPGYEMAEVLARRLAGEEASFTGADLSAKLKLLGTDVATFGDPFQDPKTSRAIVIHDQVRGIYKKIVLDSGGTQILGGILVGDASEYGHLLHLTRSKSAVSDPHAALGIGGVAGGRGALPDEAQVCSCNNVLAGAIRLKVRSEEAGTVAELKACTRAGTGCGGCLPLVTDLLNEELRAAGRAVKPTLCEHFAYSRQELFQIVASRRIATFGALIATYGRGTGCEVCKPAVASILASLHNEPILKEDHATLQDTNDRFLANIQRNGLYSVIPRIPGGEITPEQLLAIGRVAKKFGLYTKITGGQRIDLFGARVEDLPSIWEVLVGAGFESGHAYGKALRTVKSCVGSTWCRFGVQDSTSFAIRVENRYKGIRAPHKIKGGVSGCVRECAEAQGKDFGLIATERGWNVYVCGNGGASPRHADLLVSDVDEDTALRYLDRFLMFYIRTADRLTRTSVWLDKLEGGIEHLRAVIVGDSLGIAADLERDMDKLVASYFCEWADVVKDPQKRARFRHFAGDREGDPTVHLVREREQFRPADRKREDGHLGGEVYRLPMAHPSSTVAARAPARRQWVRVAAVDDVPLDGGIAVRHGSAQIAVFRFAAQGAWYATQNLCPHKREMVLARGILGDQAGVPKVACPLHKKAFDLVSGRCLSGDDLEIATFPVRIEGDDVLVELPPEAELRRLPNGEKACYPMEAHQGSTGGAPWFAIRDGKLYPVQNDREGLEASPWFEIRGNKVYSAEGHPRGTEDSPWFEVKGDNLYPSYGYPEGMGGPPLYLMK
jgi:nitrite reductase (NADH) large subunit